tara:strand:+ start:3286 stop:4299 length:1014 start_codon:yes stop_codon:yes gene_type:complete
MVKDPYSIFIVINNTDLGPGLGGCRTWKYENDKQAKFDAERLAEGMTYKNSLAGVNYGGAKGVINLRDPKFRKEAFKDFGRLVETFHGGYITGCDVGTMKEDIDYMSQFTSYCAGGSIRKSPFTVSEVTAQGVLKGIEASVDFYRSAARLAPDAFLGMAVEKPISIGIQGVGKVGTHLVEMLTKSEKYAIYINDIDQKAVNKLLKKYPLKVQEIREDFHKKRFDVFCPCAMGGVVNEANVHDFNSVIICGAANNQLESLAIAATLKQQRILYAPDFLVNSGGAITICAELELVEQSKVDEKIDGIYTTLTKIYQQAEITGKTTAEVAVDIAKERLSQ